MVNPEKQIKLGEIDPDYRRKLKEGQFKFSEKEKAKRLALNNKVREKLKGKDI